MLARWQPFSNVSSEMNRLHEEMNRLFGRYANGAPGFPQSVYPPVNLWEDEDSYFVEAELPGCRSENLEMYVTSENQLSIKGERTPPTLEKGAWHRQERGYGSFSRLMDLPGAVDGGRVSAEFKDGVLKITLPKKEEAKPRRIEVKVH